jgi:tetratricopeptide (TPR) repeat protein
MMDGTNARRLRQFAFATIGFFAILTANGARAEPEAAAKAHFRHGTAAYALGKYEDAAKEYEAAFELTSDPALLYDAAQAYRLAGNSARALELYASYLHIFGGQAANRADVQRHIAELKKALEAQKDASSSPPTTPASPMTFGAVPASKALAKSEPREITPKPAEASPAATSFTTPTASANKPQRAEASSGVTLFPTTNADKNKPLVRRAWFWGVCVSGAALVAGAVAAGIVLGHNSNSTALPLVRF